MARVATREQPQEFQESSEADAIIGAEAQVIGAVFQPPLGRPEPETRRRQLATALAAPFATKEVQGRVGSKNGNSGQILAYIDARTVMNRLDQVLGAENWKSELRPIGEKGFICRISFRLPGDTDWVYKEDVADMSQVEAIKGGASDAFKRAAVQLGVGRYLYDLESPWVQLENGRLPRNFVFPLPNWAKPESERNSAAEQASPLLSGQNRDPKLWDLPAPNAAGKTTDDDLL